MQIALFQPDIPQNTGTILRLCACLDVAAHIIEPAGFVTSDKAFRRAFVRTARRYRTVQIKAGRQILTAADPLPDEQRDVR